MMAEQKIELAKKQKTSTISYWLILCDDGSNSPYTFRAGHVQQYGSDTPLYYGCQYQHLTADSLRRIADLMDELQGKAGG